MAMQEVESYTNAAGDEIILSRDGDRWEVMCCNGDEVRWCVGGTHEGGTQTASGRYVGTTFVPFDEAAARKEYERWR